MSFLSLSLVRRATPRGTFVQRTSTSHSDTAEGFASPISVGEDELAPLAYVAATSVGAVESEQLPVAT